MLKAERIKILEDIFRGKYGPVQEITDQNAYLNSKDLGEEEVPFVFSYGFETDNGKAILVETIDETEADVGIIESAKAIKSRLPNTKFYCLVREPTIINALSEIYANQEWGVLHESESGIVVVIEAEKKTIGRRFPNWLTTKLKTMNYEGKPLFEVLRSFSVKYSELEEYTNDTQFELVQNTIKKILNAEKKYLGPAGLILKLYIKEYRGTEQEVRDHVFHSFYIFLLGIIFIFEYYDEFLPSFRNYQFCAGQDHDIFYAWFLTAVFHDIGKYAAIREYEKEHGVRITYDEEGNESYNRAIARIAQALKDISRKTPVKRQLGIASLERGNPNIEKGLITLYPAHGVYAAIRLLGEIFRIQLEYGFEEDDDFIYDHAIVASLGIIFHDREFRQWYLGNSKTNRGIKANVVPQAVLLMFLDSLHEDKRNIHFPDYRDDIIEGIALSGRLELIINEERMRARTGLDNISRECKEIRTFVISNGVEIVYPDFLLRS